MKTRFRIGKIMMVTAATFCVTGCATRTPTIQTGPDAEISYDGLHKVDNSYADSAWARPDFDISQYTKIMPLTAGFEYRKDVNRFNSMAARTRGGPYYMDADRRARFEAEVHRIFQEELSKIQYFEFVDSPGPDVLMVVGSLQDIVTFVPDQSEMPGRTEVFVTSVGEATLVLELRDSETGTILARSIDRRAAESMAGTLSRSDSATNVAAIRRVIRLWATRLREGLDGFVERGRAAGE